MRLGLMVDATISGIGMGLCDLDKPIILHQEIIVERNGSAKLMSEILGNTLRQLNARLGDIEVVFCATGPGSFTGIKVGISWVQGLCSGMAKPVKAVSYSSMLYAARDLARLNSLHSMHLILPITRTHGFCVSKYNEVESTTLIEIESEKGREIIKNFTHGEFYICNEWLQFESLLGSLTRSYKQINAFDLIASSFKGLNRDVAKLCDHDNLNYLLTPNYMRDSTAEERLIKGEK